MRRIVMACVPDQEEIFILMCRKLALKKSRVPQEKVRGWSEVLEARHVIRVSSAETCSSVRYPPRATLMIFLLALEFWAWLLSKDV